MTKIRNMIIYSLIGALGFGLGGVILGYIQGTDNSWYWILGLALIGVILGATFGFLSGNRNKLTKFALLGAVGCIVGGYFSVSSDFELWLQLAIVGLIFGVVMGAAFAMYDKPEKGEKEKGGKGKGKDNNTVIRNMRCDECKGKISKDDKFCPNCGIEFE